MLTTIGVLILAILGMTLIVMLLAGVSFALMAATMAMRLITVSMSDISKMLKKAP